MTRPNILAAIQACVTRSGYIDAAGLSAVREAWESDRRALEAAEAEVERLKAEVKRWEDEDEDARLDAMERSERDE